MLTINNNNNNNIKKLNINIPINLDKFDIIEKTKDKNPKNILITGVRSLGKTTLIKDITMQLSSCELISTTVLFTNEYKAYKYSNFVSDKNNIYTDIKETYFNQIISMQIENKSPILIILDNVIYDNNSKKIIEKLLLCSKEYNIYVILSVDYPVFLSQECRKNLDYIYSFKYIALSNIEKLYEYYFNSLQFIVILQKILYLLPNYTCLVHDNTVNTSDLQNKIYFYVAMNIYDN